jgi:hypothetical protein
MSIDFREFTALAIQGLNKKAAIRVGKALDVAIAFGALEHAAGNASLQDVPAVQAAAEQKLEELRRIVARQTGH